MRTVRSFSREKKVQVQYAKDVNRSLEIGKKNALVQGGFTGMLSLVAQGAIGLVVYEGAVQVLNVISTLLLSLSLPISPPSFLLPRPLFSSLPHSSSPFQGTMEISTLTAFVLYTLTIAMALAFIASLFGDFMTSVGASERIFELLDKKPGIQVEVSSYSFTLLTSSPS
jgi:ABC-type multidrug transport system fused ATPase/permease subunit